MIRSKDWGGKGRFSSSARRGRISRLVSGEGEEGEEEGGRGVHGRQGRHE